MEGEWAASRSGPSYVDFFRGLELEAPGRRAYLDFLQSRYGKDLPKLRVGYDLSATSWDEVATADLSKVDARRPPVAVDDEAFLNQVADLYYSIVVGELRDADPHHLVLGDRLMSLPGWTPDSILATAAKHVDVLSFQPMGTGTMHREYLDEILARLNKPVLFADTNTMTERPSRDQVDTAADERAAGEHTLAWYLDAAASKACIGIHRCTVRDYQSWNPLFHRRGLLRADDTPYPILVEYTQRTNREVYRLAYGNGRQP